MSEKWAVKELRGIQDTSVVREKIRKGIREQMTLEEKLGQMYQMPYDGVITDAIRGAILRGRAGAFINCASPKEANALQKLAVEESRLGIPLLFARDVIHGFHHMLPIPLGQAASWNPDLVRKGARMAAQEASAMGIRWTFAPMVDVTRDPRWGRIAESYGEDPHLASLLGAASVLGFQGEDLSQPDTLAACAKHFAGYGYSEAGRDYDYVNISRNELHNLVLPPFRACVEADVATLMTAFSDLNGIPATAHQYLLRTLLREQWAFEGMVVSDWDSVIQMVIQGFSADAADAAAEAIQAGVDMEMTSTSFLDSVAESLRKGGITQSLIDEAVERVLMLKYKLGLFQQPFVEENDSRTGRKREDYLALCRQAALESCVLLQNENQLLPLNVGDYKSIAIIGPMADDGYEQMGTWTFDGKEEWSVTPWQAIQAQWGAQTKVHFAKGLTHSRDRSEAGFEEALAIAHKSEVIICFMGEEAILSGEAHCRADIDLPGGQMELLRQLHALGKPIVLVVMAGRPLTLAPVLPLVDALLYAWHPGTMGGPAIADLLAGQETPSGKLPVSFPKMVGQIPIYYNQRRSGRPPTPETTAGMEDIPVRAFQTTTGNTTYHLDAGYTPLFPFGFGLSYTRFVYSDLHLSKKILTDDEPLEVYVTVANTGKVGGAEVVQMYLRDEVSSATRPVRELKGFRRIHLEPGERQKVQFTLRPQDLAFFNRHEEWTAEPGRFSLWIGGDSRADLQASFNYNPNTHG